jgi:hypothetical protein
MSQSDPLLGQTSSRYESDKDSGIGQLQVARHSRYGIWVAHLQFMHDFFSGAPTAGGAGFHGPPVKSAIVAGTISGSRFLNVWQSVPS